MMTPFHLLSAQDKRARVVLGSQRTKEVLSSSVPWYGNKAKAAAAEGKEMDYWRSLWLSGVNSLHPVRASSIPEAAAQTLAA